MPEVSVVVAAHDQAAWLEQAIASVRGQTFEDWELVVVDDGSTDDTREVVGRHAADRRVRYVHQVRQERSAARNRGIGLSSGRLVAFLDADDCWLPEKLEKQVSALAADPAAGLCYTAARFIDAAGRPLPLRKPPRPLTGHVFPELVRANVLILASVMVRRACLAQVGGFDTSLAVYGCEDWDLWLRIARDFRVVGVDEELTLYRKHAGGTGWEQVLASALLVIEKLYADPSMPRRASLSRAAARARHYWLNAAWLGPEHRTLALRLALRALRESPVAAFSRPAVAALAALVLPRVAVLRLREKRYGKDHA